MKMLNKQKFYLSVVATSRNDNHGGSLTYRMQHFVDGFVAQCIRHELNAELILVEWNPPPENIPLKEVLRFPTDRGPLKIRIITVPPRLHEKLKHSKNLPLFQMIGKNIGIRRARGNYILATNIDILFSDEVMQYLKHHLKENYLYRTDRLDIPSELPQNTSWENILNFSKNNAFRVNAKKNISIKAQRVARQVGLREIMTKITNPSKNIFKNLYWYYQKSRYVSSLHLNACGDFTLLSKQNWQNLRGYPEWEVHSWHLDSILLHQSYFHDIPQICLPKDHCIYHIEHHSGFIPENNNLLFDRLKKQGIAYIDDDALHHLIVDMMKKKKRGEKIYFNPETWGWHDVPLQEEWV